MSKIDGSEKGTEQEVVSGERKRYLLLLHLQMRFGLLWFDRPCPTSIKLPTLWSGVLLLRVSGEVHQLCYEAGNSFGHARHLGLDGMPWAYQKLKFDNRPRRSTPQERAELSSTRCILVKKVCR